MFGYRKWIIAAGLITGIFLEVTLVPALNFKIAGPHILLLLVLYLGYRLGPGYGFGLGLTAGYLKDIFSIGVIGANAVSFFICGLIMAQTSAKFFQEWFLSRFISVFLISLCYSLFYYLFSSWFMELPGYFSTFIKFSFLPALFTALIASPFFAVLDRIFRYNSRIYYSSLILPPLEKDSRFN